MKALLFSIALVLVASWVQAQPTNISGIVDHVADGDTIVVVYQGKRYRIRLEGLAAPELAEPYGFESRGAMKAFVLAKEITCHLTGKKSYDRHIGICYHDGKDVGNMLVLLGLARDCTRYSGGRYLEFETAQSKTLPLPRYCLP